MRALVHAGFVACADLPACPPASSKLLLRRGLLWDGAKSWTCAPGWLAARRFEERPLQIAYEEAQATMAAAMARRDSLDAAIAVEAQGEPWREVVGRLCCLRGVSTLTAFGLATEIGDWERFIDGRSICAYLGLCPSESSSGERRHRGGDHAGPSTPTRGACSSRPPGSSAGRCCAPAVSWPHAPPPPPPQPPPQPPSSPPAASWRTGIGLSLSSPRRPSKAGMRVQGSTTSRSRQILRARKSLISR